LKILSRVIKRRMTLSKKASDFFHCYFRELKSQPYLKINFVFAGVIMLVIVYSGIFSPDKNNYPVVCIHEKVTGFPCFSCGLSHSFSLIVRGRITEAYRWNIYGMRVFLFFFLQLGMRTVFSVYYLWNINSRSWLIRYDIVGTIVIFAVAFYPFFRQLVLSLL
jgi:hypothetical protein